MCTYTYISSERITKDIYRYNIFPVEEKFMMKVYQCIYIVPLLIAVFAIALSSSSSSYAVATTSPKKVSKWVADIAKVKKKASAIKNDSKNKKKMLQDHEISDLINGDKKAERFMFFLVSISPHASKVLMVFASLLAEIGSA